MSCRQTFKIDVALIFRTVNAILREYRVTMVVRDQALLALLWLFNCHKLKDKIEELKK